MPHTLGKRGRKIYPGDPRHGTRWATVEEVVLARRALVQMEVERNRIVLVPAPDPHFAGQKIRVQESANPAWYRRFGMNFWRSERSYQLKRARVERALRRVVDVGIVRRNGYEVSVLPVLRKEFEQ